MHDIIIIGAGPAGLTAAIYALRAGRSVLIIERLSYGGQVAATKKLENYTGFSCISGEELAKKFFDHAAGLGARIVYERVVSARLTGDIKEIVTARSTYKCHAVIIAQGIQHGKLGCKGEKEFDGKGVSYCATCDGSFFRGKDVALVGHKQAALEDALYLLENCGAVYLINKLGGYDADENLVKQVTSRENAMIEKECIIEEIYGTGTVSGIKVTRMKTGETSDLPVSGVFISIGSEIDNDLLAGQVALNEKGYIITDDDCKTNLAGVYAAGDCRAKKLKQIITAASDGAVAASAASMYIAGKKSG